ncbi:hypothetical protein [Micromonospora echinofusca]|uniref:DUF6311 domain-containing protein n=1 Tax=Micromonospora echinofusca TaxID=47858 RepID=A0ABS3VUF2_MICEH|nr:hypothetical protein [Micromonospora echinofusca]MBO4208177.1 hypothetical protein [Micromonospora echinofusca]
MDVGRTVADRPGHDELTGGTPAPADGAAPAEATGPADPDRPGRRLPRWAPDALVVAGYLALALFVTSGQWGRSDRLFHQTSDQPLFEWMLARTARAVVDLDHPLYSTQVGYPDGVNLMANTSVLGLGIPLTPVTLLFGSQVAFLVAVVGCFAGTATAWYLLLRRRLVDSRVAAAIGGLFCGFAPGMISQGAAHLHMVALFLIPVILAVVFDPRTDRVPRRGVVLGLLVTYQVFLGEEALFFSVMAAGLFTVVYALTNRSTARRLAPAFLRRLGIGAATALVLLAYPLWFQFLGPRHYRELPFHPHAYPMDVLSFLTYSAESIGGSAREAARLSPNPTEENSFFGLALLVLVAVVVGWLWRRPPVRALAVTGLVFALLGLGIQVRFDGRETALPGLYRLVADLPLLDLAVPARFPLVCIPVIAILLALSVDEVYRRAPGSTEPGRLPVRLLWTGAVVAVLLPLTPTPIRTEPALPVPQFIASGEWRDYVPPGRTLVPVPPTSGGEGLTGMFWSARTGVEFTVVGGYFIGPRGPQNPRARWGTPNRPTAALLARVAQSGQVPPITDAERAQALADLRYWRAAVVVLGHLRHGYPVKDTLDQLLGPGRMISGAWVWDVRDRVG